MKSILCVTDFSTNSDHAFQYSLAIAKKTKAKVFLLHAYESSVAFTEMPLNAILDADVQIKRAAERKLEKMKNKASELFSSVPVLTMIEQGVASEQIIKAAEKHKTDMIALGKSGTGKMERIFIGSTASKVIQHANCPVLCIPKGVKFDALKKIVFATDLKEDNLTAAVDLADFAKLFQAEIVFIFVDDKHIIHSDEKIVDMTKKIKSRVKYPKISGYICKNTDISNGIDFFLKHHSADLLAMFTHKKTFPASLFHPSITKSMASKAKLPLLVLERSERTVLS